MINMCPSRSNPADDEPDYAEHPYNVRCPQCDGQIFETEDERFPTVYFHCEDCGNNWYHTFSGYEEP